jgi:protein-L-isoaspartate(D-aspartate) O-methyltransferase
MRVARQRPRPGDLVAAARAGGVRDQRVLNANLAGQGIGNVVEITGDGTRGVPGHAPFVSAAFPAVPPPLAAQLTGGGRLVQPVGPGRDEEVVLYARAADTLTRVRTLTPASFVRLYGQHGYLPLPRTLEGNR